MVKKELMKESKSNRSIYSVTKPDVITKWIGRVYISNVEHDVYLTDWEFTGDEYGHITTPANKIYLSQHQNPHNMLITLVHEMLHKIAEEYRLSISEATNLYQINEIIVSTLDAPIVNDVLLNRANQMLFAEILKGKFCQRNGTKKAITK